MIYIWQLKILLFCLDILAYYWLCFYRIHNILSTKIVVNDNS